MNRTDATQLAGACEGLTDGIYVLDLSTGQLLANPAFFSMLGYTSGERPSTLAAWTELVHPDDHEAVLVVLAEYETGRPGHDLNVRLRAKNGEWRSVLHRGRLEQDADGRAQRIVGTQIDLTERTRSAEAFRERDAQLRSFFEVAPEGVALCEMLYGPDGAPRDYRLLAVNAAYGRYLGLALPDAVGRTGSDISGTAPPPHLALYDRVARREDAAEHESVGAPDGRQLRVSVFALGHDRFAMMVRDVTDRYTADAAFRHRIRQLESLCRVAQELSGEREVARILDLIAGRAAEVLRAGTATVFTWDAASQCLTTSTWHGSGPWRKGGVFRLGEAVVGAVAQQRRGLLVNDVQHSPYAHPFFLKQTSATAMIAEPLVHGDRLLGVLACDNEGTGRPFTPADQAALGLLAALATHAIAAAQQEEARADAEKARARRELLRALGDMADGVAHDLNNRFSAILGYVELLKLRGSALEGLGQLESAIADAVAIVKRFQTFARQRPAVALVPLDLRAAVDEAIQVARGRWEELRDRRNTIQVQTALDDLPPVLGNLPEIREALDNLISNAVEAMPEGGTITFTGGAASAQAAVLHISDTGVGMPEPVRQKVFEPFFTTKGGRGSGLGLPIAYGIMERHGGQIDVASTLGRGTTVTLQFQRAPGTRIAEASALGPDSQRRSRAILVVSEDIPGRESLVGLLRAGGLTVTEASGRDAALAVLATPGVDVVLADVPRGQRTTAELVRAIKAQHPSMPVVLLSRREDAESIRGDPTGVDQVLAMSAPLEDLLRTIREVAARVPQAPAPPTVDPLRPMSLRP